MNNPEFDSQASEYKVITWMYDGEQDLAHFQKIIGEMLAHGYRCQGGVLVVQKADGTRDIYQAMVR